MALNVCDTGNLSLVVHGVLVCKRKEVEYRAVEVKEYEGVEYKQNHLMMNLKRKLNFFIEPELLFNSFTTAIVIVCSSSKQKCVKIKESFGSG